jgi:hypothetical protein
MRRFKALGVPPALMAVIAKAPVLAHESKDAYFALLARHFQDYGASRVGEFMTLIRATNCYWEITRLEEGRARLIDHWEPIARTALVKDHTPEIYNNFEQVLEKKYPVASTPPCSRRELPSWRTRTSISLTSTSRSQSVSASTRGFSTRWHSKKQPLRRESGGAKKS